MTTENKKRLWRIFGIAIPANLLLAIVLVVGGVGGGGAYYYTSTPQFCATCHSMSPHSESWKVSAHAETATCIECHSGPGPLDEFIAHMKGAKMLYMTVAGIEPHLTMSTKIPNSYCTKCHSMDQEPNIQVKVNHKAHLDKGTSCQACHFGLVHLADQPKAPNEQYHGLCLNCHETEKVVLKATGSTSCSACHADLTKVTPEDHTTDWMAKHGKLATSGQSCGQCHTSTSAGPHGPMANPAIFVSTQKSDSCASCHAVPMPHGVNYVKSHGVDAKKLGTTACASCHSPQTTVTPAPAYASANFCASCHAGVPMPHEKNFASIHGKVAGTSNNPSCATCHSSANPVNPTAKYAANDYCAQCHAGVEMPHTKQFTVSHGKAAHQSGISCAVCHSASNPIVSNVPHTSTSYCAACHDQYKHPAGWVATHGLKTTTQSCSTCHSVEQGAKNSCRDCHPGNPGEKKPFHPDRYWFINHGSAARAQGESSCAKCHSQVQPSCAQCHTRR